MIATRVGPTERRPALGGRADRQTPIAAAIGLVPAAVLAILAFSGIGERAFWLDEVWSVDIASRPLGGVLDVVANREANMGLYYVLLSAWLHLGQDEATVRSLSALAAVATVIATGVLGAHMFNRLVACASTVMLGTSAFLLTYAREARAYALVALVAVASFAAFVRMVERGERRDLALWVAASTVLVYLHMLAGLLLVAQAVSLLAARDVRWRRVAFAFGALAIACSPLLAFALFEDKGQSGWIPDLAAYDALSGALGLISGGRLLVALLGLLVVCALIAGVRRSRVAGRGEQTFRFALVTCWAAVPPLVLLALSQWRPLYVDRYLIGMLPGYALLVGLGVDALPRLPARLKLAQRLPAALAISAVIGGAVLRLERDLPTPQTSEDLRAAARFLDRSAQPSDGLAFTTSWSRVGLAHYLRQEHSPLLANDLAFKEPSRRRGDILAGEVSPATLNARMRQRSRIWLVSYPPPVWKIAPDPVRVSGVAVLRAEYTRVRRVEFGDLRLDLYRRVA